MFWHRDGGIYVVMLMFELLGGAAMDEEIDVGITFSV